MYIYMQLHVHVHVHASLTHCDLLDDSNASITAGHSHHSQMNRGVLFSHTHQLVGMGTGLDCPDAAEGMSDAEAHSRKAPHVRGLLLVGEVTCTPQLYQSLVRQLSLNGKCL